MADELVPAQEKEGKPCIAFEMDSAEDAWNHMAFEVVEEYGGMQYGNTLYTWDRGDRTLLRCKKCGGYVLCQSSEYSDIINGNDDYYDDYFPVSGPEEADALNRKYDGFAIEREFPGRCLMRTNGKIHWSVMNQHATEDENEGSE